MIVSNRADALVVNFTSSASGTSNTICRNQNLTLFVDGDQDFDFYIEYRNSTTGNNWVRFVAILQSFSLVNGTFQITGDKINTSDYRIIDAIDNVTVLASLSITVNPLPSAPTANSISVNYNGLTQSANINTLPSGQSSLWYTASSGGSISSAPSGINASTYNSYAASKIDATGCVSATRTLVFIQINKVQLSVTADDIFKGYDGITYGSFTSQITGYVNGESSAAGQTGSITYSGNALTAINAGTYVITPVVSGLSSTNYTYSAANGTLQINKVQLTVTAVDKSKSYDGSVFSPFTSQITGYVNGESSAAGQTGSITYSGSAASAINAGTYVITPIVSGLSSTNYTYSAANGTLNINKIQINITAEPKEKIYGTADPVLTYAPITGLVGTDNVTGSLARQPGESVGNYDIQLGSLSAGTNYTINFTKANFVIKLVTVKVEASPNTKKYGELDPDIALTFTPSLQPSDVIAGKVSREPGEDVGEYLIKKGTIDLGPNYNVDFVENAKLTITKGDLTIKVLDVKRTYGDNPLVDNPNSNKFTTSGLKFSETVGSVKIQYPSTIGSGNSQKDPVGLYVGKVTASDPTGGSFKIQNYNIFIIPGDITVEKRKVKIIAEAKVKKANQPDPIFTFTINPNLVAGDVVLIELERVNLSESPGYYPITLKSSPINNNYEFDYIGNNLQIEDEAYRFVVPDAFTPNGDNLNDKLRIFYNSAVTQLIYFNVYNRLGSLVFSTSQLDQLWDGKMGGVLQDSDAYVWFAQFKTWKGDIISQKGSVLLLK